MATRCRCRDGGCVCVSGGRRVPVPAVVAAAGWAEKRPAVAAVDGRNRPAGRYDHHRAAPGVPAELAGLATIADVSRYLDGAEDAGRVLVAAGRPVEVAADAARRERRRRAAALRRWRPELAYGTYHGAVCTGVDLDALGVLTAAGAHPRTEVDDIGYAYASAVLVVRRRGDRAGERSLVAAIRRHVESLRAEAARDELDRLARQVLGPVGALVASARRREAAQARYAERRFDELFAVVHGPERAQWRRLWRQVHGTEAGGVLSG